MTSNINILTINLTHLLLQPRLKINLERTEKKNIILYLFTIILYIIGKTVIMKNIIPPILKTTKTTKKKAL